ncbi:MAG TPA: hypothetical protein VEU30_09795 [Thermoanaerobaculia bacterium]|nr:hypothetical protein [Thermoanaerobaculia bacterium]
MANVNRPDDPRSPDDVARPRIELPPGAPPMKEPEAKDQRRKLVLLVETESEDFRGSAVAPLVPCNVAPHVTIAIREAPSVQVALAGAALTLHSEERQPPAGGTLTWSITGPTGAVTLPLAVNTDDVTLTLAQAGSDTVTITHLFSGVSAIDTCIVEVCSVTIAEAPARALLLPALHAAANTITLHAAGTPGGGHYQWSSSNAGVLRFGGGVDPGDVNAATFETVTGGRVVVRVDYRVSATLTVFAVIQIDVVSVGIQEAPRLEVSAHDPVPTLHAVDVHPPAGGQLTWTLPNAAGVLNLDPAVNAPTMKLAFAGAGTEVVQLDHAFGGVTATAQVTLDVVSVAITIPPSTTLQLHAPGAAANVLQLQSVAAPLPGIFAWRSTNLNAVDFTGGVANTQNVSLDTIGPGSAHVNVDYTFGTVTVSDTILIDVVGVRIAEAPWRAMECHLAGDQPETMTLHAVGGPANGNYTWTITAGASVVIQSGANAANVTIATATGGTTTLQVRYDIGGQQAMATIDIHVVAVTVPSALELIALGNPLNITATGIPGPGGYAWRILGNDGRITLGGGAATATATFNAVMPGLTRVQVDYTAHGVTASTSCRVQLVSVRYVQADPLAIVHDVGQAAGTAPLRAIGDPAGGVYSWVVVNNHVADFQAAPGNTDQVVMQSVGAGSTTVVVTYTVNGVAAAAATAAINLHVVNVTINPANANVPEVIKPFGPATAPLTANGTPGGGTYAWTEMHPLRVRFQGGANPGNVNVIQVERVNQGRARFRVRYTAHGVMSTAHVDVVPHCAAVQWQPAVAGPVGAAAAIGPVATAACTHENTFQHPFAAPLVSVAGNSRITVAPAVPHHHGHLCHDCIAAVPGSIYHWIDPDAGGAAAAADALALRNQIGSTAGRYMWGWNNPGPGVAQAAAAVNAANHHVTVTNNWPWLVNIGEFGYFVLGAAAPWKRPKMFGVLRGVDAAGNPVKLRAISGGFPGLGTAQPNTYWSPALPVPTTIENATRGTTNYAATPGKTATFGECAAAKLLTHASHLGLQVQSMAEIWIGVTQNNRADGQFQASCNNCGIYIGRMLCESGGAARGDAFPFALPNPDPQPLPPNNGF